MIAPYIIDRVENEQRKKQDKRDRLWIEAPEERAPSRPDAVEECDRGVNIIGISPANDNTIRI